MKPWQLQTLQLWRLPQLRQHLFAAALWEHAGGLQTHYVENSEVLSSISFLSFSRPLAHISGWKHSVDPSNERLSALEGCWRREPSQAWHREPLGCAAPRNCSGWWSRVKQRPEPMMPTDQRMAPSSEVESEMPPPVEIVPCHLLSSLNGQNGSHPCHPCLDVKKAYQPCWLCPSS